MIFQGIIPNTNITKVSIARKNQFKALKYEISKIEENITYINEITICFESGIPLSSISIIQVFIFINIINFYIINTPILFFIYLKNINILGIYLNSITY